MTSSGRLSTMTNHNPHNERIKRRYFAFLKEAHKQSEASVDAAAKALARFEHDTRYRDFRAFHYEQAIAFKRNLRVVKAVRTGKGLSPSTLATTLAHLKRFFLWLAGQAGYRSKLNYSDAEYFNLTEKESRIAAARRDRPGPTIEQVRHVLSLMPDSSPVEKRDRAVIAFTLLTGARDGAIVSFQLKHLDVARRCVEQDARAVNTKYSKTFTSYFFPVGEDIAAIVATWARTLRDEHLWGNDDPLFPATKVELGPSGRFEVAGLDRCRWSSAAPVRAIFRRAFTSAKMPYFNPHSFRKTLVQLGESKCQSPEEFKAWSQNLGHEGVLTTFHSYGAVPSGRQAELISALGTDKKARDLGTEVADAVLRRMVENNFLGRGA
jgi:integrase